MCAALVVQQLTLCYRALERMRIPKILSTSAFSANPFETIRKHAQNTLVKHEVPK